MIPCHPFHETRFLRNSQFLSIMQSNPVINNVWRQKIFDIWRFDLNLLRSNRIHWTLLIIKHIISIQIVFLPSFYDVMSRPRYILFPRFSNASSLKIKIQKGKQLGDNREGGVFISNQSLVIRRIGRHTAGNYTCIATNRMGESTSNPLHLHVKCKSLQLFT